MAQELRAAQFKGLPLPILWIAEYFVVDGELIRWGRSFRTAGWFAWQVLWYKDVHEMIIILLTSVLRSAVPTWLIANILSFLVLYYAGCCFVITGVLMLTGVFIFASIRWGTQPMVIPFEDATMMFDYGASFWLTLAGGQITILSICMPPYATNNVQKLTKHIWRD